MQKYKVSFLSANKIEKNNLTARKCAKLLIPFLIQVILSGVDGVEPLYTNKPEDKGPK